ncbi:unnamed protein product [Wuchereria bancrofti]|uniref:Uncharacterized protein n=1 Tax=Wuchereria bancrofti TaxID=6293 RepID=A0A3P7DXN8_WUCBA|nr:unnamed protein product [Wuchereria bancrofti]
MTYIPSKDRAKVIRSAFVKEFGKANVSVQKGRGTASSWVEAHIYAERPKDCVCEFTDTYWNGQKAPKPYRKNAGYCPACKAEYERVNKLAKELENKAMQTAGYEHSTYYADDGYNTEHSEFLLQVDIK